MSRRDFGCLEGYFGCLEGYFGCLEGFSKVGIFVSKKTMVLGGEKIFPKKSVTVGNSSN